MAHPRKNPFLLPIILFVIGVLLIVSFFTKSPSPNPQAMYVPYINNQGEYSNFYAPQNPNFQTVENLCLSANQNSCSDLNHATRCLWNWEKSICISRDFAQRGCSSLFTYGGPPGTNCASHPMCELAVTNLGQGRCEYLSIIPVAWFDMFMNAPISQCEGTDALSCISKPDCHWTQAPSIMQCVERGSASAQPTQAQKCERAHYNSWTWNTVTRTYESITYYTDPIKIAGVCNATPGCRMNNGTCEVGQNSQKNPVVAISTPPAPPAPTTGGNQTNQNNLCGGLNINSSQCNSLSRYVIRPGGRSDAACSWDMTNGCVPSCNNANTGRNMVEAEDACRNSPYSNYDCTWGLNLTLGRFSCNNPS